MLRPLSVLVLASASLVAACEPPGVACTEEARESVHVKVTDDFDAPLELASVTMQPEGQLESPCGAGGVPGEFSCGFEVDGAILIRAAAAGYSTAEETVTVGLTDDGCHVVTEQLTLQLFAVDG